MNTPTDELLAFIRQIPADQIAMMNEAKAHRRAFDLERYAILRDELETLKRQVESAINWLDLGEPLKARDTLLKAVK